MFSELAAYGLRVLEEPILQHRKSTLRDARTGEQRYRPSAVGRFCRPALWSYLPPIVEQADYHSHHLELVGGGFARSHAHDPRILG